MKAVAITPGEKGSAKLIETDKPSIGDIKNNCGVLVEVLRVGACGTDREINNAEYGIAPEGSDHLILGHENFGRVVEVGENVKGSGARRFCSSNCPSPMWRFDLR